MRVKKNIPRPWRSLNGNCLVNWSIVVAPGFAVVRWMALVPLYALVESTTIAPGLAPTVKSPVGAAPAVCCSKSSQNLLTTPTHPDAPGALPSGRGGSPPSELPPSGTLPVPPLPPLLAPPAPLPALPPALVVVALLPLAPEVPAPATPPLDVPVTELAPPAALVLALPVPDVADDVVPVGVPDRPPEEAGVGAAPRETPAEALARGNRPQEILETGYRVPLMAT